MDFEYCQFLYCNCLESMVKYPLLL